MTDRRHSEFEFEDSGPQPSAVNRIWPRESGSALAVDLSHADIAVTQLAEIEASHRLWLPEGYEPGYAYPLIVWLHNDGGDEMDLDEVMPRISERNYIGVSLRGNVLRSVRFGWSSAEDRLAEILAQLHEVVEAVADRFSVNPHRKYLAGFGAGGTLAWEILLRQPSHWTGAMCLSSRFPEIEHPLAMFRELQQRRLLLAAGLDGRTPSISELVRAGRLMYSAGLQVGTRIYDSGSRFPTDRMLRDLDHWVMDAIATAVR
jgi:phospholipase/carboxylesterase